MNILNLFKRRPKFKSGALPDDRTEKEKKKDYEHKEVAQVPVVDWKEKPKSAWADYPVFDQDGSGSCVAQAIAKALGIENIREESKFVHLSARDLYSRRENDGAGMYTHKALEDVVKNGMTLEQLMPSQRLDEEAMNKRNDYKPSDKVISQVYKPDDASYVKTEGVDEIAEALEMGHPVIYSVKFRDGEWDRKVPKLYKDSGDFGYHKVTAIDYFMWNGKKAILTDDSWGPDNGYDGRRVVTEDWFKKDRAYSAYYFRPLSNTRLIDEEGIERPEYEFNEDLEYHDRSNEVAKLQEALKYEGFFPMDTPNTGWYGGITRKAVKEFQYHYEVAPEEELESVDGFRVGPKTRAKLNELF